MMTFDEWFESTVYTDRDCAKDAWDYQQAKIDELDKELAKTVWEEALVNSKLTTDDDLTIAYMKGYSDGKEAISKMETPNGYVLVPVEPTERMIDFAVNKTAIGSLAVESIYKAMIHAAQEQEL